MTAVSLKYVVSFSSQDETNTVNNLTKNNGYRKWLSHPKDKSGRIEAVFQLQDDCIFNYIDLGLIWCAMVEVQVGRSDWPQGKDYKTLIPTVSIMSPVDCRTGGNSNKTRMFGPDDFSEEVAKECWDRIRLICRQPFRKDVQYGLSFIRIKSNGTSASETDLPRRQKSIKSIHKHFFGKSSKQQEQPDELKSRLLKIAGSGENGTLQEESLTRTAKLVMAASGPGSKLTVPIASGSSPSNRPALHSNHIAQKYGPQFEKEVGDFLCSYKIDASQLDKVTLADIRHKFEKLKNRKLSQEEKKTFVSLAREYICVLFADSEAGKTTPESKCDRSSRDKEIIPSVLSESDRNILNQNSSNKQTTEDFSNSIACQNQIQISEISTDIEELNLQRKLAGNFGPSFTGISAQGKNVMVKTPQKIQMSGKSSINKKKESSNSPKDETTQKTLLPSISTACRNRTQSPKKSNKSANIEELNLKRKLSRNFGPSFTHISPHSKNVRVTTPPKSQMPGKSSITQKSKNPGSYSPMLDTNDQWLNASTPPVSISKKGQNHSGQKISRRDNICRKRGAEEQDVPTCGSTSKSFKSSHDESLFPGRGRKVGRGRGHGRRRCLDLSRETTPTSFERCINCKESFPEDQIARHRNHCQTANNHVKESNKSEQSFQTGQSAGGFLPPLGYYSERNLSDISRTSEDVVYSGTTPFSDQYVECPLCGEFFRQCTVERHASTCCM